MNLRNRRPEVLVRVEAIRPAADQSWMAIALMMALALLLV